MAYTQAIDAATPAGTDDAKTADDQIRALKRDIIERFQSVFTNVNADPLMFTGLWGSNGGVPVLMAGPSLGAATFDFFTDIRLPTRNGMLASGNANDNWKIYFNSVSGKLILHSLAQRYEVNLTPI